MGGRRASGAENTDNRKVPRLFRLKPWTWDGTPDLHSARRPNPYPVTIVSVFSASDESESKICLCQNMPVASTWPALVPIHRHFMRTNRYLAFFEIRGNSDFIFEVSFSL